MNSKQIKYFLEVSECLNFTQAGERLYASQTTISRQILALEEELGFDLFYRDKNSLRLTYAGAIMIPTFKQMQEFFEEQKKIAVYTNQGRSGQLKIGFLFNSNINSIILNLIEQFGQQYPNVLVNCICFTDLNAEQAFQLENIDILFSHDFCRPDSSWYETYTLFHTELCLVYGIQHHAACREPLTIYDFKGEVLWTITGADTYKRNFIMDEIVEHYQIIPFRKVLTRNSDSMLMNIILGNGIAIMDTVNLPELPSGLKSITLDKVTSQPAINITWKKQHLNPAVELFTNLMVSLTDNN